jgi:hypothetical protein
MFLGDDKVLYYPMLVVDVKVNAEEEESPERDPKKDDMADYLGYLVYWAEKAKTEGTEDHLPIMLEGVADEEEA